MRSLLRGEFSLSQAIILDWRVRAIVLAALVSSQGCGIISDTPSRALSTRGLPPSESQPSNRPSDKPAVSGRGSETSPEAKLPSPPETKERPWVERTPDPSPPTMTETGLASWYGPKFHGKLTASGEVFNQEHFTAAHPTLPWGSRVKVINLDNGKSVAVRINDRGPFKRGRIIDVSRAAARALGMVGRGITTVRIEWLADSERTDELALQDK
jgi:rare lipoprotein A (peptidoglycan hydrolase)